MFTKYCSGHYWIPLDTLNTAADIASVVGLGVSIFGLVYAFKAAVQAKSARQAAEAALRTLRHRDAVEEITTLVEMAAQLSHFVQNRDSRGAAVRATDLSSGIQTLASRRFPFVESDVDELNLTTNQLTRVGRSLAAGGVPDDPQQFSVLFSRCQKAHSTLSGLVGKAQRAIEDEDYEHP